MSARILLIKSRSLETRIPALSVPMGVMYLASYLREHEKAEIAVFDTHFSDRPVQESLTRMQNADPVLVGISSLTPEAPLAHMIAAALKKARPGLPVLLGGPYGSSDPSGAVEDENIDAVVIGEGESTLLELVRLIRAEGPNWRRPEYLAGIKGVAYRENHQCFLTEPRPPIMDLDAIPFPAWDLIDYRKYWERYSMTSLGPRPYMALVTSRGCPFRCLFCHNNFGKRFRSRSPENVVAEIAELWSRGVRDIEIIDDIPNFHAGRFNRILEGLLEKKFHPLLHFPNGVRCDMLAEESIRLLKEVGVGEVSVPIESPSRRIQKLIGKNLDIDKAADVIERMADARIFMRGFFMTGFPTETESELRETLNFAFESRLHLALFFRVIPFKGTDIHSLFLKNGKMVEARGSTDYEFLGNLFNGSEVPDSLFNMLVGSAYTGFYENPLRIFRICRDWPTRQTSPNLASMLSYHVSCA